MLAMWQEQCLWMRTNFMQLNTSLMEAIKATSEAVERVLDPVLTPGKGMEAQLVEAMRYSMFSGGKRLRPILVLASAAVFDVPKAQAIRVGAAIECVHCMSLIHDDLPAMDDDDLRRGKPTCHKQYDEATAILAGDSLLLIATELLAHESTHSDSNVRIKLIASLMHAAGHAGMMGGQMIDILAENRDLSEAEIHRLQHMKTGALITFSVTAGAILANATEQEFHALQGYSHDLGLAFQIADDLLDVEGSEEEMGKAIGKDEQAGKATLVSIMGVERAKQQARLLADQAIEHLSIFDEKANLLRALAHFAINRRN